MRNEREVASESCGGNMGWEIMDTSRGEEWIHRDRSLAHSGSDKDATGAVAHVARVLVKDEQAHLGPGPATFPTQDAADPGISRSDDDRVGVPGHVRRS